MNRLTNSPIPHATQPGTSAGNRHVTGPVVPPVMSRQPKNTGGRKAAKVIAGLSGILLLLFAVSLVVVFPKFRKSSRMMHFTKWLRGLTVLRR